MLRILLSSCLCATLALADARYKLAYTVKANPLIQMVAGIAGFSKLSSPGDEVLLRGSKISIRTEKSTVVVDYATGQMLLIDHVEKNFERLLLADMQKRISEDIPTPLVNALKKLFPSDGKSMDTKVLVEREGKTSAMPSIEKFRSRYGLAYLAPAMESIISLTPSVEEGFKQIRREGSLATAVKVLIGAEGRVIDSLVEIVDYHEVVLTDASFLPPSGYAEVKVP